MVVRFVVTLLACSLIVACGASYDALTDTPKTSTCDPTDACLLKDAEAILANLDDNFAWSTAAAELAIAYDAARMPAQAARVIGQATDRAATVDDGNKRVKAYGDIATALASMHRHAGGLELLRRIDDSTANVDDIDRRAEILGKIIVGKATQGAVNDAFSLAMRLPESEGNQGAYKAVTLRKISAKFAQNGEFESAERAAAAITTSLDYYQSTARSDIAIAAAKAGKREMATALLDDALGVARSIEDGYFRSACLREIAVGFHFLGKRERATALFEQAESATSDARTPNESARSMSRIATRMSDIGLNALAESSIARSLVLVESVEAGTMRVFSDYEIAGAAAFSGHFDVSRAVVDRILDIEFGATASIRSAAERDLAWGLARHGAIDESLTVARGIKSPRERVQALSRIVRLLREPEMPALPRYL